jgi:hypothetical protein
MNVITWNKAYSIFRRQTIVDHQLYPLGYIDDRFGSDMEEIACQGWRAGDVVWPDLAGGEVDKMLNVRCVGDGFTLMIPLDTTEVHAPSTPDSVLEYAQFTASRNNISAPRNNNSAFAPVNTLHTPLVRPFLTIRSEELASPALRHIYTIDSREVRVWYSYVEEKSNRWTWVEWLKLRRETRPERQRNPLRPNFTIPQDFKLPSSWDYADDQIPRWYREWELAQAADRSSLVTKLGRR